MRPMLFPSMDENDVVKEKKNGRTCFRRNSRTSFKTEACFMLQQSKQTYDL